MILNTAGLNLISFKVFCILKHYFVIKKQYIFTQQNYDS
jgi:hypothetical protein